MDTHPESGGGKGSSHPRSSSEIPLAHSAPVLILDDDPLSRSEVSGSLLSAGWQVSQPSTAAEGLELAKQGAQVIIVGRGLPDMSAAEICHRLKSEPKTRVIPVLCASDPSPQSRDSTQDLALEADAFLPKPVDRRALLASVRVLSRLHNAEAGAATLLAKWESVTHHVVEGVITADGTGRFLTMNPAAVRIYGFESATLPISLERQEQSLELTEPGGQPLARERWPIFRAVRGEVVSNFEIRIRRRDTGRTWIGSFNAALVGGTDQSAGLVLVTFFDVTSRKEVEQALHDAQSRVNSLASEVEQKVEERTASLREAVNQMEEFSYTVSHDLRAPLRSIRGYAEILVEDQGPRMKGDGLRYLERIVENGDRMERLVNDVLTISRISNIKVKLGRVVLDPILSAIVRESLNLKPAAARFTIDPLPLIFGQESLCVQVFSNLLSNAAKFVKPGLIPQIRVWADRIGDMVRINVRDNGIGVSPEYHQKIFGMFERLDPDNRYGGTGIGLAIVRRAVEKMNGRVGVESDGSSGSRFWVELPAWTGEK